MLRYLIVVLSILTGAVAGLFGGITFFAWFDPHPNAATQAGMGEGLLLFFGIVPAFAIAAGVIAVKVTKYRGLTFEVPARVSKLLYLVVGAAIVMAVIYFVATGISDRLRIHYRFDVVNKTGHWINGLAVSVDGKVVTSAYRLGIGGSHTEFSPPATIPVEAEVSWFDETTKPATPRSSKVRIQAVLPPNFGHGRRADSVYFIVQPTNTVDVKTAPAGDAEAHRAMYR
jgi:hypothetical protein